MGEFSGNLLDAGKRVATSLVIGATVFSAPMLLWIAFQNLLHPERAWSSFGGYWFLVLPMSFIGLAVGIAGSIGAYVGAALNRRSRTSAATGSGLAAGVIALLSYIPAYFLTQKPYIALGVALFCAACAFSIFAFYVWSHPPLVHGARAEGSSGGAAQLAPGASGLISARGRELGWFARFVISLPGFGLLLSAALAVSSWAAALITGSGVPEAAPALLPLWLCFGLATGCAARVAGRLCRRVSRSPILKFCATGLGALLFGTLPTAVNINLLTGVDPRLSSAASSILLFAGFGAYSAIWSRYALRRGLDPEALWSPR